MGKTTPLISVIITNYNYAQYVGESIKSVLAQTYKNMEVIIIDDGSTDESCRVIEQYARDDIRVNFVRQKNRGVVPTRNLGLDLAQGEYLIFIDADDLIPRNFIEEMYKTALKANGDVAYCDLQMFGKIRGILKVNEQTLQGLIDFSATPICQLVKTSSIGMRRFDSNLNRLAHEDNDFFFGLFSDGAKFAKSKVRYKYRIHGEGRNPGLDPLRHYRAMIYIYGKYQKKYPELREALVRCLIDRDSQIKKWHSVADDRLQMIYEKDSQLDNKNRQIQNIINSKRYKIGKIIVSPISAVKSVLKRGHR